MWSGFSLTSKVFLSGTLCRGVKKISLGERRWVICYCHCKMNSVTGRNLLYIHSKLEPSQAWLDIRYIYYNLQCNISVGMLMIYTDNGVLGPKYLSNTCCKLHSSQFRENRAPTKYERIVIVVFTVATLSRDISWCLISRFWYHLFPSYVWFYTFWPFTLTCWNLVVPLLFQVLYFPTMHERDIALDRLKKFYESKNWEIYESKIYTGRHVDESKAKNWEIY